MEKLKQKDEKAKAAKAERIERETREDKERTEKRKQEREAEKRLLEEREKEKEKQAAAKGVLFVMLCCHSFACLPCLSHLFFACAVGLACASEPCFVAVTRC